MDAGPDEIQVTGTRGIASIALTRGEHERLRVLRAAFAQWEDLPLPKDAYTDEPRALTRMIGAFIDAVLRGDLNPELDPSFEDGLRAQRAIGAAVHSARSAHWEQI